MHDMKQILYCIAQRIKNTCMFNIIVIVFQIFSIHAWQNLRIQHLYHRGLAEVIIRRPMTASGFAVGKTDKNSSQRRNCRTAPPQSPQTFQHVLLHQRRECDGWNEPHLFPRTEEGWEEAQLFSTLKDREVRYNLLYFTSHEVDPEGNMSSLSAFTLRGND